MAVANTFIFQPFGSYYEDQRKNWEMDVTVGCSASNRSGILFSSVLMVVRNFSTVGRRNPHFVSNGEQFGLYLGNQRGYRGIEAIVAFKYVN